MGLNQRNPVSMYLDHEELQTADNFTYLVSIVCTHGGADVDIKNRMNKARGPFVRLKPVCRSTIYSRRTKLRLYQSSGLSTLLCGSEGWRMTKQDQRHLSTFHTKCLRNIMRIFWPQKFSKHQLLRMTGQSNLNNILATRRWTRKEDDNISKIALRHLKGKENEDGPKNWRKTAEEELKQIHVSWSEAAKQAAYIKR